MLRVKTYNMHTYDPEPKESTYIINPFLEQSQIQKSPTLFLATKSIIVLDNVLSLDECDSFKDFINSCDNSKIVGTKKKIVGNCPWLSELLMSRCSSFIPNNVYLENSLLVSKKLYHRDDHFYWNSPSINQCWRMVRCSPGSSLSSHFDGKYVKSVDHKSIYTIMVYLSDNSDGELSFDHNQISLFPKPGRVVIFDQDLLHHGNFNSEYKYFIRSEIMYSRSKPLASPTDIEAMKLYSKATSCFLSNPIASLNLEQEAFSLSPLLEHEILVSL